MTDGKVINVLFVDDQSATREAFEMARGWRSRRLKLWIPGKQDFKLSKVQKDRGIIDASIAIDRSVGYVEWNSDEFTSKCVADNALLAMIQRMRSHQLDFVVVGQEVRSKGRFVSFVDAVRSCPELPDVFYRAPWFSTREELESYLKEKRVLDVFLDNAARYSKTSRVFQGAPVYKDLDNGSLIYKDMRHLSHYEVFDSTGRRHLGIMSRDGLFDRSKAVPGRTMDWH